MAEAFQQDVTKAVQAQERERRQGSPHALFPPEGTEVVQSLVRTSLASAKYRDRPAAADIAFFVTAIANGMKDDRIKTYTQ